MFAYSKAYLDDVVGNQGKLFLMAAEDYPETDTRDFIETYMKSKTRKSIDNAMAYTITMDAPDLMDYFLKTEHYSFKKGEQFRGFFPDWLGEFYAYYQWYYNIPSSDLTSKIPVDFLRKAYPGIHDLELELAVQKVGIQ